MKGGRRQSCSVSEWFLAQMLKVNGLSLKDVTEKNMTAGEAGAAFVASNVDLSPS